MIYKKFSIRFSKKNLTLKRKRLKYTKLETGRSMVEMLGILAIIGVLSVMGVMGYRQTLIKHRTNEIFHECMMQHIQLQTNFNKTQSSWQNIENTAYSLQYRYDENGNDYIKLTDINEQMCQELLNIRPKDVLYYTLYHQTFDICQETNDLIMGFNDNAVLSNSELMDTGTCDNGNVYLSYHSNPCDTSFDITGNCVKNSDCDVGKYCLFSGKWTGSDAVITNGTCSELESGTEVTYNGKKFLISQNKMTWWQGENWCKAHHTKMIASSRDDLGCVQWSDCPESTNLGTDYFWIGGDRNRGSFSSIIIFSPVRTSGYNRSGLFKVICTL